MNMEETAVLLSIRPEWCQKIFRGEKTMEIRKSFPKDFQGQPFKCFIYCTKGQNAGFRLEPDGGLMRLDGTVIGEFTCDRVYEIAPLNHAPDDLEAQACMDRDQIWKYTHGKGYAWHITELKTYETPLDLAAFHLRCENALRWCNNGGCAMHIERPANGNCCGNYGLQLNRPPQSWCYVVGPGECHKELQEQVKATLNRIYPRKKVSDILPKSEILGQLAEELAEASAAASKLRRKIDGKNPTPKTLDECWEDLKKEIGDVMNSIDALTEQDPQNYHEFMSECGEYAEPKMERWLFRLNEQRKEHAWKNHQLQEDRVIKGILGRDLFMRFWWADIPKICVENPIPSRVFALPKYTQSIQPYQFGHPFTKKTCLWLKGLSPLEPTDVVEPTATWCPSGSYSHKHGEQHKGMFTTDRARNRAKTFPGIAEAMAEQWGGD